MFSMFKLRRPRLSDVFKPQIKTFHDLGKRYQAYSVGELSLDKIEKAFPYKISNTIKNFLMISMIVIFNRNPEFVCYICFLVHSIDIVTFLVFINKYENIYNGILSVLKNWITKTGIWLVLALYMNLSEDTKIDENSNLLGVDYVISIYLLVGLVVEALSYLMKVLFFILEKLKNKENIRNEKLKMIKTLRAKRNANDEVYKKLINLNNVFSGLEVVSKKSRKTKPLTKKKKNFVRSSKRNQIKVKNLKKDLTK